MTNKDTTNIFYQKSSYHYNIYIWGRKHPGGNIQEETVVCGGNDWEQYSPCIYCRFPTVCSPQIIIILNVKSQVQIFKKKSL